MSLLLWLRSAEGGLGREMTAEKLTSTERVLRHADCDPCRDVVPVDRNARLGSISESPGGDTWVQSQGFVDDAVE